METPLSDGQRGILRGKARYWKEVAQREDTSPLQQEMNDVYVMLGTKILFVIMHYLQLLAEKESAGK